MKLYDNAFSPFARKVRLVLQHKRLDFESIDGLAPENRDLLAAVNPRVEVPVLEDGDVTVVNSADIVAYLDYRYPERPVHPADPGARVAARAWERLADTKLDALLHDASIWTWPILDRTDSPPPGLQDAVREELHEIYAALERELGAREFVCGALSIADLALFPHLSAVRFLGVPITPERYPRLVAWYRRMREIPMCREDLDRIRRWLASMTESGFKSQRIVWRGDRIEWLVSRGFHEWFFGEIAAGRVGWPRR
jgi:glutathione S-transferase